MSAAVIDERRPDLPRTAEVPSPELDAVLAEIGKGASKRELERLHPFAEVDLLRQARSDALRIDRAQGSGASFRELLATVIALGDADSNVAHIYRSHVTFVERFARNPRTDQGRRWQRLVTDGAIVGLANAELDSATLGGAKLATRLTRDGTGYRLDGRKYHSTGTLYADLVQVRAAAPDGAAVSAIIPTDRAGVERLTSGDGVLAALAAGDLGGNVRVLLGGTTAWVAAGLPVEGGAEERVIGMGEDVWCKPNDWPGGQEAHMREHLTWELDLVAQAAAGPRAPSRR